MLKRNLGVLPLCCLSLLLSLPSSMSVDLIPQFPYLHSRKWPHPKTCWKSGRTNYKVPDAGADEHSLVLKPNCGPISHCYKIVYTKMVSPIVSMWGWAGGITRKEDTALSLGDNPLEIYYKFYFARPQFSV